MIRRLAPYVVLACLWPAAATVAQETAPPAGPANDAKPWAFGLGLGLSRSNDEGSLFYSANLRRKIHFKAPADDGSAGAAASASAPAPAPEQGRHGGAYVEPEVGYWKRTSDAGEREKDVMVGVNVVGVVPTKAFDLFLGAGFGAHFLDSDAVQGGGLVHESSTHFGANVQFGVEVDLSQSVGLFGEGRVDLVDTTPSQQSKVWAGLRFRF